MKHFQRYLPFFVFISFLVFLSLDSYSQSSTQVMSKLETEVSSVRNTVVNIVNVILGMAAAIGLIGIAYKFFSKQQDAREGIISWVVGVIVVAVGLTIVNLF